MCIFVVAIIINFGWSTIFTFLLVSALKVKTLQGEILNTRMLLKEIQLNPKRTFVICKKQGPYFAY